MSCSCCHYQECSVYIKRVLKCPPSYSFEFRVRCNRAIRWPIKSDLIEIKFHNRLISVIWHCIFVLYFLKSVNSCLCPFHLLMIGSRGFYLFFCVVREKNFTVLLLKILEAKTGIIGRIEVISGLFTLLYFLCLRPISACPSCRTDLVFQRTGFNHCKQFNRRKRLKPVYIQLRFHLIVCIKLET